MASTYARDDTANYSSYGAQGAFYVDQIYSDNFISHYNGACLGGYDTLDANNNIANLGNPMAGHAIGPDIHPYSIYMVPLITY